MSGNLRRSLRLVRWVGFLSVFAAGAACGDGPRVNVEKKYCVLAGLPYQTPAQLHALRVKGVELVAKPDRYTKNARNERIVNATINLLQTAHAAELALKYPKVVPPAGLKTWSDELAAACKKPAAAAH